MEHIQIALSEVKKGVREYAGTSNNNPQILNYAFEAGLPNNGTDEYAWCSIFMNWVALKAGLEKSNKVNARSWLNIGLTVKEPAIGDVVIFWRGLRSGWQGHVGIFYGFTHGKTMINVLGGNQNNAVNIRSYAAYRVLGYRRLRNLQHTIGELRLGNTGKEVTELQHKLNKVGYNCGKADGHFGKQTEAAIIKLQTFGKLPVTGFYDLPTQQLLAKQLPKNYNTANDISNNNSTNSKKSVNDEAENTNDWLFDELDFDFDFDFE